MCFRDASTSSGSAEPPGGDGSAEPRPRSDPSTLIATNRPLDDEHRHVPDGAATTRWDGHLERDYAMAALAQNLNTPARRSA